MGTNTETISQILCRVRYLGNSALIEMSLSKPSLRGEGNSKRGGRVKRPEGTDNTKKTKFSKST